MAASATANPQMNLEANHRIELLTLYFEHLTCFRPPIFDLPLRGELRTMNCKPSLVREVLYTKTAEIQPKSQFLKQIVLNI